ncbi:unnamed protein product [Polarella glacialis]|uniref:RanBP2-type domain-containing protein n=1 Tax=Polarella glacialis TaxID=89957 RepID=A0A813FV98_POLGL|nr:unnamed protein product [Polarella glacialis]
MAGGFKEGDWNCDECGDHQFARNATCRKCGAPKPGEAEDDEGDREGSRTSRGGDRHREPASRTPVRDRGMKEGDWNCDECGDHQFAKNTACRKCGAPRPGEGGHDRGRSQTIRASSRQPEYASRGPSDRGGGRDKDFKDGDWSCASCGDHQFARNTTCRKCGEPRSDNDVDDGYAAPRPAPRAPENSRDFKDGDWTCGSCGDHQFGRNNSCRKCGDPKPVVSSNNQLSKAGDWICPNPSCKDLQFEKNQECRRCHTPKPRAVPDYGRAAPLVYGKGAPHDYGRAAPPDYGRGAPVHDYGRAAPPDYGKGAPYDHGKGGYVPPAYAGYAPPTYALPAYVPIPAYSAPPPAASGRGYKPGDWICPACGDHQFERNQSCRKCQGPKPSHYAAAAHAPLPPVAAAPSGKGFKEGDWSCPACGDHQFERNQNCRKCSEPKPQPGYAHPPPVAAAPSGKGFKEGDWSCPACGDHQFERNQNCRKCGEEKPPPSYDQIFPVAAAAPSGKGFKEGDWSCPACGDHQFERNQNCRKCSEPKPQPGYAHPPPVAAAPSGKGFKEGDWSCPACGDHQFERNQNCRKCGEPKPPQGPPVAAYSAHHPAYSAPLPVEYRSPPAAAGAPPASFKPGDWTCSNCGDHQFSRNESCRKCSMPKPQLSSNQIAMKPGDWICPNDSCADVQFARNGECRRCGTPKPDDRERSRSPPRRHR